MAPQGVDLPAAGTQQTVNVGGLQAAGEMIRAFPEVRAAFSADPVFFLQKYVQIDVAAMGIRREDLPSPEEMRRQIDQHLATGNKLAIAVCAVVV